ncbi:MAG TPA: hypothetical protein VGS20_00525 [Candidatus Acidoferrales bacterium]|nr:hypothetical protein [Candidatus Acidoferrales bacterium]
MTLLAFPRTPGRAPFRPSGRKAGPAGCRDLLPAALLLVLGAVSLAPAARAQQYDPSLYSGMRWRQIGPFRAGRVSAVSGIAGNPAVYYIGTPGGGVWETTDGGLVWKPSFDQEHVASIGALEVAPSNPKIIYVATGDVTDVGSSVNQGDGMYKSTDGGLTWRHIGLDDTRHIGTIWVDPRDPDVVVVAALGHTFAKNQERGVFKTADGGVTWRKVLYEDDETGAIDVAFDPGNPRIGFAALWQHYVPLARAAQALGANEGGAIYKTTDEGDTWTSAETSGFPGGKVGRIGVAVAMGGQRVYAIVSAERGAGGLYRSDDGGQSWRRSSSDSRVVGNSYFSRVFLDPRNSDVVYVMQTSMYRSTDGGRNFIAYKGAPGGDDNHVLWIDPTNSNWMIMGSDQGATISMDGGRSWNSWYNQPTGQVYHLSVDNRWPYWVYGTQQDSGSIAGLSRGDYGAITMLDWDPIGGYEFGYILPDPLDPDIVYAGGPGRGLVRIDRTNRQLATISPNESRDGEFRTAVNPPLAFSPQDPHVLYEGTQVVLETSDAGLTWRAISPDLTVRPGAAPPPGGENRPPNRTAINTLAPSSKRAGEIWAGTTNGVIQLTEDGGKSWRNVSPPGLSEGSVISIIEASPFDAGAAYAAVDNHQVNDFNPHIYRTRDAGRTWQAIDAGISAGSFVRVVREDPARRGLLYAGAENGAYVSFDDGDHWQSLQLDLPTVSVRDLVVHGDDLVAATYGRAFWILDDLTPLRQLDSRVAASDAWLFQPATATRVRRDQNGDTPFPPEMPAGQNPPTGAIVDYYLKSAAASDVTLGVYDSAGHLVRQFSSAPLPPSLEPPPNVPDYWLERPQPMPKAAGLNRFVWDLRYPPPPALRHNYPISALYGNTPGDPRGPLAVPGKYELRLSVNGRTYRQPLEIVLDPRVRAAPSDLASQLELGRKISAAISASYAGHQQVADFRTALAARRDTLQGNPQAKSALDAADALDRKAAALEGSETPSFNPAGARPKPSYALLNRNFGGLTTDLEGSDTAPTEAMQTAYGDYCRDLTTLAADWSDLKTKDLAALNAELAGLHLEPVAVPGAPDPPGCGN